MFTVTPIAALTDNYIWLCTGNTSGRTVIIDPGEAQPVIDACTQHHWTPVAIWLTHHHWDHCDGIDAICQHYPGLAVIGPKTIAQVTHSVVDGDQIVMPIDGEPTFRVMATPGHTLDHLCYTDGIHLFCGDTLFAGGCGRVYEGTMQQMAQSLGILATLPESVKIYCGHEYSEQNLAFAHIVEPDHRPTQQRYTFIKQQRAAGRCSLPSTMKDELESNPFLRCHCPSVQAYTGEHDPVQVFTQLRQLKDRFK